MVFYDVICTDMEQIEQTEWRAFSFLTSYRSIKIINSELFLEFLFCIHLHYITNI